MKKTLSLLLLAAAAGCQEAKQGNGMQRPGSAECSIHGIHPAISELVRIV